MTFDVLKYKPIIDRTARHLQVPVQDREDAAQECYIDIFKAQATLESLPDGDADKYVHTVCKRTIQRFLKREREDRTRVRSLSEKSTERQANRLPVLQTEEPDMASILDRLPVKVRLVVEGMYTHGWGVREAAEKLGVHRATVWRRLKSAEEILTDIPK